ncbi:hypothetical protein [Caldalkalibacillus salinus]|uniref:hypothetical protein n=1 Tax=Caldalkalibacillus salinus TaxID=2803787 RepID=UPI001922B08B|nr:hypothetical protein [Caldalkalibacillus salinus]
MKKAFVLFIVFTLPFVSLPVRDIEASNHSRPWVSHAWKIISKTGDWWFDTRPKTQNGPNADLFSSGSLMFNSNQHGPLARHDVEIQSVQSESIEAFAQTSAVNWPGNITIIISDPDNNDVVSQTVTSHEFVYHEPDKLGSYTVRYVQNHRETWDAQLYHWHSHKEDGQPCAPHGECVSPDGLTLKEVDDGKFYIVPSEFHMNARNTQNFGRSMTLSTLQEQNYDQALGAHVRYFKNFDIGDDVIFEDMILDITYDPGSDETRFAFEDRLGGISEYPFKGDLRQRYDVGQTLKLAFTVVSEYDSEPFEVLNYIKYGLDNDGEAPEIDDYLVDNSRK